MYQLSNHNVITNPNKVYSTIRDNPWTSSMSLKIWDIEIFPPQMLKICSSRDRPVKVSITDQSFNHVLSKKSSTL